MAATLRLSSACCAFGIALLVCLVGTNRTVAAQTSPTVTVSPVSVIADYAWRDRLTVTIAGAPGGQGDWIGLFVSGAADRNYLSWRFLNGAEVLPPAGLTDTTFSMPMPSVAGTYEVRLFTSGWARLATSATITVNPSITALNSDGVPDPGFTVYPGTTVRSEVVNSAPPSSTDWVGLFPVGAADDAWLDWTYLNNTKSPPSLAIQRTSVRMPTPAALGVYELRLFANNGYALRATSLPFTVRVPAQVQVTPSAVRPGETVYVTVTNAPGNSTDWLGVYPASSSNARGFLNWAYLSGTHAPPAEGITSTTVAMTMPDDPGTYNVQLYERDKFGWLGTSSPVTVLGPAISATPTPVRPGDSVTVTVENGPGFALDWVGVFTPGDSNLSYQDWWYLNGARTPPGSPLKNTSFTARMPSTPGIYELRFFRDNYSWWRMATSTWIVVTDATIRVDTTTVSPGGTVVVTIADGPANVLDWVGVNAMGAADLDYESWRYLSGTQTPPPIGLENASFSVTMPSVPGTYNLRLFRNNGSTLLATTTQVRVVP